MKTNFCARMMKKLENLYPEHQIFRDWNYNRDEKRIVKLKQVMAIADCCGLDDFRNVVEEYVNECNSSIIGYGHYNAIESYAFEVFFMGYCKKYEELFELYEVMKNEGIDEFPVSFDYSIEEWLIKWIDRNSYFYLRYLVKWFKIDFKKLAKLQSKVRISYEKALKIMEHVAVVYDYDKKFDFFINVKFVMSKQESYSALQLFFDSIFGVGNRELMFVFSKFLEVICTDELNHLLFPFWKTLEFDNIEYLYVQEEMQIEFEPSVVKQYGVNLKLKTIFYNSLIEIVEMVDKNNLLKLPKKIVENFFS